MMEIKPLMEAQNLSMQYGKREIVKGVDICIERNEIIAMIGPNGAGKTTTLEMLIGLRKPDTGTVYYWDQAYKKKIGVQLQAVPFFPGLSAMENLKLFASFYKLTLTSAEAISCLTRCGIADAAHVEAAKLSGGQQKRLAIAVALIHDPELIFLDEPTAALDPRSRQEIHTLISTLSGSGKTIVFTSHDMDEVAQLATRVILIDAGQVIAQGHPAELCAQHEVDSLTNLYVKLTKGEQYE